jgi:beta-galactosidase
MIDRKGITDRVTLNGMTLMNWEICQLPMDAEFVKNAAQPTNRIPNERQCVFFKGEFNLEITADTYFDMSNYAKGMLYVNGHDLGRYWNVGPQQRLYCPANWLKKGKNEIIVFDLYQLEPAVITGKTSLE